MSQLFHKANLANPVSRKIEYTNALAYLMLVENHLIMPEMIKLQFFKCWNNGFAVVAFMKNAKG